MNHSFFNVGTRWNTWLLLRDSDPLTIVPAEIDRVTGEVDYRNSIHIEFARSVTKDWLYEHKYIVGEVFTDDDGVSRVVYSVCSDCMPQNPCSLNEWVTRVYQANGMIM